jgi:3-hexulose-6-phosphate synthase
MRLQLALDIYDISQSLTILKDLHDVVDIVEIGTPFIIRDGVHAVKAVKDAYPNLCVLADLKIMDGGYDEAKMAFEAGADIVTVLAAAENITIQNVVKAGREYKKEVMADLIAVPDLKKRAMELDGFGLDYICVHTAFDIQHTGRSPLEDLKQLKSVVKNTKAAVAGGVKVATLPDVVAQQPDIVIVGMGISGQPDMRGVAKRMKEIIG